MSKLGNQLVVYMSHLDLKTVKRSFLISFQDYKNQIWEDPRSNPDPWLYLLDLIAYRWGYYGELDSHLEAMEKRLRNKMKSFNERKKLDDFIFEIGKYKEEMDEGDEKVRQYLKNSGATVIDI